MPAENDPHRTAALAALKRGDAGEAIRCLTEAVQAAPEDAELAGFLGVAYGMEGDLDAAVFWLRKATQLGPNAAPAFYNLGGALERAGQPQEAIGAYRRALVLEPQHPRARAALARMENERAADVPIASPFPASPAPAAEPEMPSPAPRVEQAVTPAPDAALPELWTCRCGASNASGYAFCPRCGAPAPEPSPTPAEPESEDEPGEPRSTALPSRRVNPVMAILVATPLLVALGFGIGKVLQGPQETGLPNAPVVTAPPPSTDIPPAPAPAVPPANAPVEAPQAGAGLGITRDQVSAFLERDIEWAFQVSTDEAGRPRTTGRSADGLTDVEMIGDPENLESVYLSFVISPDEAWSPNLPNGRRVEALFEEYAPGASRWALQNMEELFAAGGDGERRERFANRYAHLRWLSSSRRAQAGITTHDGELVVTPVPAPEENWLKDPRKIPRERRYRFLPRSGGDAIVGTLVEFRSDIYTVRLDSGEMVELHGEDGYDIEPLEPTDREREWLREAEAERKAKRQAALRRNYVDGRPLEVGRRYRFRVIAGENVEGTLESLEDDLFHIRPDDRPEPLSLQPENVDGVEAL